MLELSNATHLLEENAYRYQLQDVEEQRDHSADGVLRLQQEGSGGAGPVPGLGAGVPPDHHLDSGHQGGL